MVRSKGGVTPFLNHEHVPAKYAVVCSRSVSRTNKCMHRTGMHASKLAAIDEWNKL